MKKQRLQYWILAGDITWALIAFPLAHVMRYGYHWYEPAHVSFSTFLLPLIVTPFLWCGIFCWMQLDGFRRGWRTSSVIIQLLVALCLLVMILMTGAYLFHIFLSRLTFIYFLVLLFIGFSSLRCLVNAVLGSKYVARTIRRVLIVGNGAVAREMAMKIHLHPEMLCKVVGFLNSADTPFDPRLPGDVARAETAPTLGLIQLLREKNIDEIVITAVTPGIPEMTNLAARCRQEGIGVSIVPHPYELYLSKPQLLNIGGLPLLQLREPQATRASEVFKRGFDLVSAYCLAVLSTPIVLIGALGLLRRKGGPLIRELRCGQFGKHFWMYRLNSNRVATDLSLYERVLQQLSITEIPQLWNVIRGEMSLVGPRPESPERVKHYSDWERQRLKIKPGLTGLAQVNGLREQHSSEEKTRFDLQYMMDASLFVDISLILQTLWTLIGRVLHLYRLGSQRPEQSPEGRQAMERILLSADSAQSSAD